MDIRDYQRILRATWSVIAVVTLVGVALGYGSTHVFPKKYESTATLFVGNSAGVSDLEAYQNSLLARDRAVSYASLAASAPIAQTVATELDAPTSVEDLRDSISADVEPETVLVRIHVENESAERARDYANAVAAALIELVDEVETVEPDEAAIESETERQAVRLVQIESADLPTEPTGPSLKLRLALGGAAGLVLGLLLGLLIGILDKRLRGRSAVEDAARTGLLASLPRDKTRAAMSSVSFDDDTGYVEALRELRTNLTFATLPDGRSPRVVAIVSPGPEEGRTTVAIDLGLALAESGRSVLVVDGDLRNPDVADLVDIEGSQGAQARHHGVSSILAGADSFEGSVCRALAVSGSHLDVLPAGPAAARSGDLWAAEAAQGLIHAVAGSYDFVIIDTPALGHFNDAAAIAALCDGAVLLARIRQTTASSLAEAVQTLAAANGALIGTVATFERTGRRRPARDARPSGPQKTGSRAD